MDSEPSSPEKTGNFSDINSPETSGVSTCSSSSNSLYNMIQKNGRRICTIENWFGPVPDSSCELYVSSIPRNFVEDTVIKMFQRFGQIYEVRFMLDFNKTSRGYCYIKYADQISALRAKEVMNHFNSQQFKSLKVNFSYDKCRLFIGNIPKDITEQEVENELRHTFPKMKGILLRNRIECGDYKNRGFAFIDFGNHEDALEVKKLTTPGRIRKWGRDLRVVWANPECIVDPEVSKNNKTLFIRNINLKTTRCELFAHLTKFVERSDIIRVSQTREYAFVDMVSREKAELLFASLDKNFFNGFYLRVEWALPPSE